LADATPKSEAQRASPLSRCRFSERGGQEATNQYESHAKPKQPDCQQQLLRTAAKLLPARVRISVPADSDFRSQLLFDWLRKRRWNALLGIRGNVRVATDPCQAWCSPMNDIEERSEESLKRLRSIR
jgi:hypothetical protein